MQYMWQLEKAFLKDILDLFPEPKPHTNTVSTLIKILIEKGFVDYTLHGRSSTNTFLWFLKKLIAENL